MPGFIFYTTIFIPLYNAFKQLHLPQRFRPPVPDMGQNRALREDQCMHLASRVSGLDN